VTDHYVLAIDQGTSATKCLLLASDGSVLRRTAVPLGSSYPHPGWVEQDPEQIWDSVVQAVRNCLSGLPAAGVAAVGLSTQRESVLFWDRLTGRPLTPLLGWQDQRAAPLGSQLLAAGHGDLIRTRSGLPLDPMFSALKACWLVRRYRDAHGRDPDEGVALGTIDAYLLARLCTGPAGPGHVIEAGNASRTQLMDVRRREWDSDLLRLFEVPAAVLPRIVASAGNFGQVSGISELAGRPVRAVLGDSHAALYAHGPAPAGTVKATYGTGSSVMSLAQGDPARDGRLASLDPGLGLTLAWETDQPAWALEGNIRSTGATLAWLSRATEVPVSRLVELGSVDANPGIHIVPAFTGLGAPWWSTGARGLISGLTFETGLAQLARAALESTAFQVADVVSAMERCGAPVRRLLVDGEASANNALMQFQADLCGVPVVRPPAVELSALGTGRLAAETAGLAGRWPAGPGPDAAVFQPRLSAAGRRARMGRWRDAVAAAVGPGGGLPPELTGGQVSPREPVPSVGP
jgi:glycerol kinase